MKTLSVTAKILLALATLIVLGALPWFIASRQPKYYGDLESTRTYLSGYDRVHDRQEWAPKPDMSDEGSFRKEFKDGETRYSWQGALLGTHGRTFKSNVTWKFHSHEPLLANKKGEFSFPSGNSGKLVALGVGYPTGPKEFEFSYFRPETLEPLDFSDLPGPLPNVESEILEPWVSNGPVTNGIRLNFLLDLADLQGPSFDGAVFRDALTDHKYTYTRQSTKEVENYKIVKYVIARWHDGPLLCSLDMIEGPWQSVSFPLETGASLTIPGSTYELEILRLERIPKFSGHQAQDYDYRAQYDRSSEFTTYSVTLQGVSMVSMEHETLMFCCGKPSTEAVNFRHFVENEKGERIEGKMIFGRPTHVYAIHFPIEPSAIRGHFLSYSEPARAVTFELDSIPGLPPENYGLTNLFDAQIPYAEVSHYWAMHGLITEGPQIYVDLKGFQRVTPDFDYEGEYRNRSLCEMMDIFLQPYGSPNVIVDRDTHTLRMRRSLFREWWQEFRSRF